MTGRPAGKERSSIAADFQDLKINPLRTNHNSEDSRNKMEVFTKEAIKALNNEAVYLSTQCYEYIKAIDYLQRALILCKYIELPHHSASFSSKTLQKIKSSIVCSGTIETEKGLPSRKIKIDEGLYSYTRTLPIVAATSDEEALLQDTPLSFHSLEAVLCFNLGVCYLLGDQDQEAALYFSRTEDRLLSQSTIYNDTSSEILVVPTLTTNDDDKVEPFRLDSIAVLHNIGLLKYRAEEYEESLQCYIKAKSIAIAKNEANDMSVAVALNSIGILLSHTTSEDSSSNSIERTYADAIGPLNQSLLIRTNILGYAAASDKDTGTVLNNIGSLNFLLNDFEEALNHHHKAYMIRKRALGDYHIDTGVAAFNIGKCYQRLQKTDDAFEYYSVFVKSILGSKNLQNLTEEAVMAFDHIATGFQEVGAFDLAADFYELTLHSARKVFGERDAFIAQVLNRRGNMFSEFLELEDSLESYLEGLEIEYYIYPPDHPNIATTRENIERVLVFRKRLDIEDKGPRMMENIRAISNS